MYSLASPYKHPTLLYFVLLIALIFTGTINASTGHKSIPTPKGWAIIPENSTEENVRWSEYFYQHIKRRSDLPDRIVYNRHISGYYEISVSINDTLKIDFAIHSIQNGAKLTARNKTGLLWLMYQVMKYISIENSHINTPDLPPALIHLSDTCGTFAFEYRSLYTPITCLNSDMPPVLGNSGFDADWGIWGHGLVKILGKNSPESVYATVDGIKKEEQFCFSSPETYRCIEHYILDNFGEGEKQSMRFAIFPADNKIVCNCAECKKAGNSLNSASPAVTRLIIHLANRFPKHQFFTSAYLSTQELPQQVLPINTGIIVSAIDFPLRYQPDGEMPVRVAKRLTDCHKITSNILVWDYINNYDDYLTPFPVLKIIQQRLHFYQQKGVKGIFLNGSGYDYSTLSDMQSFVLSALLINPDLSVDQLVSNYFKQAYPHFYNQLIPFYLGMENKAIRSPLPLNIYGGISESKHTFLHTSDFVHFYNLLQEAPDITTPEEKKRLNELRIALSFTRLEIARSNGSLEYGLAYPEKNRIMIRRETDGWLKQLEQHPDIPGCKRYRESGGEITTYLNEWRTVLLPSAGKTNLLLNQPLKALTPLDEDYTDLSILCDGLSGLPDNYHCGWLLHSQGNLEIAIPQIKNSSKNKISLTFLKQDHLHISIPEQVELYKNGKLYKKLSPSSYSVSDSDENPRVIAFEGNINISDTDNFTIRIIPQKTTGTKLALDEIRLTPQNK
ncbi:DUF4838 domain-containing protein [Parabacteroides sp. FAFU027]|uniref:DUF4838 domain-containing protein n=1 Tax=Parabacteroides sp. FAFU027 TaxID=2922715 RepID=UPI001FAEA72E|nr:DUF4838 domain-containing protein [Parabacteroides sp. FAFU027]